MPPPPRGRGSNSGYRGSSTSLRGSGGRGGALGNSGGSLGRSQELTPTQTLIDGLRSSQTVQTYLGHRGSDDDSVDSDDDLCPICMEELDLTDRSFRPCACGYQMCRFCWHNIANDLNNRCPACRSPYNPENFVFEVQGVSAPVVTSTDYGSGRGRGRGGRGGDFSTRGGAAQPRETSKIRARVDEEETALAMGTALAELESLREKMQRKQKRESARLRAAEGNFPGGTNRKPLANVRVVQRNLVYVTNLPVEVATEEHLRRADLFGQFGKLSKIVINRNHVYGAESGGGSVSCYITFRTIQDAHRAISCCNGTYLNGKQIRLAFGTTKYCSYFLRGVSCCNPDCMYLHELGDDDESFTKDDMSRGKHTPLTESAFLPAEYHERLDQEGVPFGKGLEALRRWQRQEAEEKEGKSEDPPDLSSEPTPAEVAAAAAASAVRATPPWRAAEPKPAAAAPSAPAATRGVSPEVPLKTTTATTAPVAELQPAQPASAIKTTGWDVPSGVAPTAAAVSIDEDSWSLSGDAGWSEQYSSRKSAPVEPAKSAWAPAPALDDDPSAWPDLAQSRQQAVAIPVPAAKVAAATSAPAISAVPALHQAPTGSFGIANNPRPSSFEDRSRLASSTGVVRNDPQESEMLRDIWGGLDGASDDPLMLGGGSVERKRTGAQADMALADNVWGGAFPTWIAPEEPEYQATEFGAQNDFAPLHALDAGMEPDFVSMMFDSQSQPTPQSRFGFAHSGELPGFGPGPRPGPQQQVAKGLVEAGPPNAPSRGAGVPLTSEEEWFRTLLPGVNISFDPRPGQMMGPPPPGFGGPLGPQRPPGLLPHAQIPPHQRPPMPGQLTPHQQMRMPPPHQGGPPGTTNWPPMPGMARMQGPPPPVHLPHAGPALLPPGRPQHLDGGPMTQHPAMMHPFAHADAKPQPPVQAQPLPQVPPHVEAAQQPQPKSQTEAKAQPDKAQPDAAAPKVSQNSPPVEHKPHAAPLPKKQGSSANTGPKAAVVQAKGAPSNSTTAQATSVSPAASPQVDAKPKQAEKAAAQEASTTKKAAPVVGKPTPSPQNDDARSKTEPAPENKATTTSSDAPPGLRQSGQQPVLENDDDDSEKIDDDNSDTQGAAQSAPSRTKAQRRKENKRRRKQQMEADIIGDDELLSGTVGGAPIGSSDAIAQLQLDISATAQQMEELELELQKVDELASRLDVQLRRAVIQNA